MREKRQEEAVQAYLNTRDRRSIIYACPRFGKIKVAIEIMKRLGINYVWIFAPRTDIFDGWKNDFDIWGGPSVREFITFTSIKKINKYDFEPQMIIIDEPHELSLNQQTDLAPWVKKYPTLALTGTMTQKTRIELYDNLILDVCYKYTIDQGVQEGILTDYTLNIHKVPLDRSALRFNTKGRMVTEKKYFDMFQSAKALAKGKQKWFLDIKMIHLIQNSYAKMKETIRLLNLYEEERVLVFCGTTEIADSLGIPVYHSKAKEKEVFDTFCKGEGENHLATIKMMQAGITIKPIKKGIINYMSGNPEDCAQKICRFLGLEYDNPRKEAEIHIISSDEEFELGRLNTGLLFFDKSKINYVCA